MRPGPKSEFRPGLQRLEDGVVERVFCTPGRTPRWSGGGPGPPLRHSFEAALIVSDVGTPVSVEAGGSSQWLGHAETLLLPAALGEGSDG